MTREELLLELKDISPPAEPGWWLLAPGQLIVILLILALVAACWIVAWRQKSRRNYISARLALTRIQLTHLDSRDSLQLARELAQWLKQVALIAFPQSRLEGMTGSDWLAFLDSSLKDKSFSHGVGRIFAQDIYRRHAQPDADRLLSLCSRWLNAVKPRLLRRGQG